MAQVAHGVGDTEGVRKGEARRGAKSVGKSGLRGVAGAYVGYAVMDEGSVVGRKEDHRWISALCQMR